MRRRKLGETTPSTKVSANARVVLRRMTTPVVTSIRVTRDMDRRHTQSALWESLYSGKAGPLRPSLVLRQSHRTKICALRCIRGVTVAQHRGQFTAGTRSEVSRDC